MVGSATGAGAHVSEHGKRSVGGARVRASRAWMFPGSYVVAGMHKSFTGCKSHGRMGVGLKLDHPKRFKVAIEAKRVRN